MATEKKINFQLIKAPGVFRLTNKYENGEEKRQYIKVSQGEYVIEGKLIPVGTIEEEFFTHMLLKGIIASFKETYNLPFELVLPELTLVSKPELLKLLPLWEDWKNYPCQEEQYIGDFSLCMEDVESSQCQEKFLEFLNTHAESFSMYLCLLHLLGVSDIKPEHFYVGENNKLIIIDYAISIKQLSKKNFRVSKCFDEGKNFIDFESSPNKTEFYEINCAFKELKLACHFTSVFEFLTKYLSDPASYSTFEALTSVEFIHPSNIKVYYEEIQENLEILLIRWQRSIERKTPISLRNPSVVIYTYYERGALGDVTGAIEIYQNIQQNYPHLNLSLHIEIDKEYYKKRLEVFLQDTFPDSSMINITFIENYGKYYDFQLRESHVILFQHMSANFFYYLIKRDFKSLLFVSGYQRQKDNLPISYHLKDKVFSEKTTFISSGIGKDASGIFPIKPSSIENTSIIKEKLRRLPTEGFLFGGYINQCNEEIPNTSRNDIILSYLCICALIVKNASHKQFSLVINFEQFELEDDENGTSEIYSLIKKKEIRKLNAFKCKRSLLTNFGVSKLVLHHEDGTEIDVSLNKDNLETGITMHMFNPFPMGRANMYAFWVNLSEQVHPFILGTMGNFTPCQIISLKRVLPFFQVMIWDQNLWKTYKSYFKEEVDCLTYLNFLENTKLYFNNPEKIHEITLLILKKDLLSVFERIHSQIIESTKDLRLAVDSHLREKILLTEEVYGETEKMHFNQNKSGFFSLKHINLDLHLNNTPVYR